MTDELVGFDKKLWRSLNDRIIQCVGGNIKLTCRELNRLKTLINDYGQRMKSIINIVKEDLNGSVQVTISRGRMELDDIEELKRFLKLIEAADYIEM